MICGTSFQAEGQSLEYLCDRPKGHKYPHACRVDDEIYTEVVAAWAKSTMANTERHPKWVRVEPGTVIQAGQPYRTEARDEFDHSDRMTACEFVNGPERPFTVDGLYDGDEFTVFVDSSWRPPMVLPTEPTWGIVIDKYGHWAVAEGRVVTEDYGDFLDGDASTMPYRRSTADVRDFIPLTEEQVQRIENAR